MRLIKAVFKRDYLLRRCSAWSKFLILFLNASFEHPLTTSVHATVRCVVNFAMGFTVYYFS